MKGGKYMKIKNRLAIVMLIMLSAVFLVACGTGRENGAGTDGKAVTVEKDAGKNVTDSATKNDDVDSGDFSYSAKYMRISDYAITTYTAFDAQKDELIVRTTGGNPGEISVPMLITASLDSMESVEENKKGTAFADYDQMVKSKGCYYTVKNGSGGAVLVKLDESFAELDSVVTGIRSKDDLIFYSGLCADSDGVIYILANSACEAYDSELQLLYTVKIVSELVNGMAVCGNDVYMSSDDGKLYELDKEKHKLVVVDSDLPPYFRQICGADGKIYICTSENLYEYDIATAELKYIVNLTEYGIYGWAVVGMYAKDDGTLVLLTQESYMSQDDYGIGVSVLSRRNEPDDRTEIVVAAYCGQPMFDRCCQQFIRFMRNNPQYKITVKDYLDEFGDGITFDEFTKMLISGNDADIFVFNQDNCNMVKNLADKGILYGLDDYLEADAEYADAIFPNILDEMKIEGKLYGIAPYFSVETLTGRTSIVGDRSEWTVEKILDIMRENEELTFLVSRSAYSTLYTLLTNGVCMDEDFIKNKGFESDEFLAVLELCRLNGERNAKNNNGVIFDEKAIIDKLSVVVEDNNYFDSVRKMYALYKDDEFVRVGYPSESGGRTFTNWLGMLCMNSASDNKDAAWMLISDFLSEDFFTNSPSGQSAFHPVVETAYDKEIDYRLSMKSEMTLTIYSLDSAYNLVDEGMVPCPDISKEQTGIMFDEVNAVNMSQFDIDYDIIDIVIEEAQYYFDGQKTAQQAAAIIQDRVQLYMDEIE